MADVRKLLQAERRQRDANNKKNPATAPPPPSRPAGKRPLSENSGSSSKRTKTSAPTAANLPADFFSGGPVSSSSNERAEILDPRASKPTTTTTDDDPMSEAATSLPQDFFQKNSLEDVDEDEWAAFQAEVAVESSSAAIPGVPPVATVITAAPTLNSAGGEQEQRIDDDYGKGEEEDAKQKLLDEFEEMESLEQRVLRLKERREALKSKHPITGTRMEVVEVEVTGEGGLDDDDGDGDGDDDEYEDDFFRARGS
ncbi:hypothetical protein HOY80DRAFT_575010 [Tuber brumale]|nr:hypothetical protein HOY80DRAFT_575010 [Tuber brumale]